MTAKTPRRVKRIPQRTCVGCRMVLTKRELIRIVRTEGGVIVDPGGKAAGRGAYLHNLRPCWEKALKGPLAQALKTQLSEQDLAELRNYLHSLPPESPDPAQAAE